MTMKMCASGLRLLAGILLLMPAAAFGAGAVVDCSGATPGAFTSINAALASLPAAGPNSITVSGTCHENVVIVGRTELNISGNPTATITPGNPNGRVLVIFESRQVGIQNLVLDGGRGVSVFDQSRADFDTVTIQNSAGLGMTALDSLVHISNTTIQNSVRSGISISGGTFYVDGGVHITNNGRLGIAALTAHLILNGGDGVTPGTENVISGNGTSGVEVASTSEADISADNRITGNSGSWGLVVLNGSSILMTDGTISNNSGMGVHCGGTSHCEFGGNTHINSNGKGGVEIVEHSDTSLDGGVDVSSNTGIGVLVDQSSSLTSLGGNTINTNTDDGLVVNLLSVVKFNGTDIITGNGKLALECNNGSMVSGDISTYKPKKCGNAFQAQPIK
ncbi:MAG: hypothetical protein DMG65_03125 [Candidatus Angelobacter sp. Gp1-AA117]|nr:MAG: hypothetical protein DMG65_03125 [Candidatus Angelobacter sp. Gp1-AA117]